MKIVIIGTNGNFIKAMYNELSIHYHIERVVFEESVSKKSLLIKRIKKLGPMIVVGQILFKIIIETILRIISKKRVNQIMQEYSLDTKEIPLEKIDHVDSINSMEAISLLKGINPDMILVMGTRIINEHVLQNVECDFINMHMGITPLYRGVHGGYWALAEKDQEHCGVTIHYIDRGIDTGKVIEQKIISPKDTDNFVTYPLLQLGEGMSLLKQVIEKAKTGKIETKSVDLPSKLRTHPTIAQYIYYYLKNGVK